MLYEKEASILVFLFILLILLIITLSIVTSKIEIKLMPFILDSKKSKYVDDQSKVIIKLKLFGNVPIIKFAITNKKLKRLQKSFKMNEKIEKIEKDIIQNKDKIDVRLLAVAKEIWKSIEIKKLELAMELGTENAFLTSMLVAILSSVIAIGFSRTNVKEKDVLYEIKPIYTNQNFVKIAISGIFQIKMVHIINIIYVLNKKGGMKNNERTSNRRSYDYSYE